MKLFQEYFSEIVRKLGQILGNCDRLLKNFRKNWRNPKIILEDFEIFCVDRF